MLELKKHFEFPIQKKIQFFELKLTNDLVDNNYFIKKIDEGCELEKNMSFKTNVKGKMTDWRFFQKDENFIYILKKALCFLPINEKLELVEAWGIKMNPGNFTQIHAHNEMNYSGILYLNDADNKIFFPEINVEIQPKKNTILVFSGILDHYTNHVEKNIKYAIPFNMIISKQWDR